MKTLLTLIALATVPLSLSAQTKPTPARKPASAAVKPAAKPVAAAKPAASARPATKPAPAARSASAKKPAAPATTAKTSKPVAATTAEAAIPEKQTAAAPASKPATAETQKTARAASLTPARSGSDSRFRIGFRVGGNLSTFGGVNAAELGAGVKIARVMGVHGGVILNIGGPKFSVQPEILFSQYGFKMAAGSEYLKFNYNVVEVPVLFKATFGQPGVKVFVNAGPVVSYVLNGKLSVNVGGETGSQKIDMKNEGRLAYGAAGGLGVALDAGPGTVLVEGRYNYLINGTDSDGSKLKPQNAMISVGYLIPLSR